MSALALNILYPEKDTHENCVKELEKFLLKNPSEFQYKFTDGVLFGIFLEKKYPIISDDNRGQVISQFLSDLTSHNPSKVIYSGNVAGS